MLSSITTSGEIKTEAWPNHDTGGIDFVVWLSPESQPRDPYTLEDLEALVHRGVVRELLKEDRRGA